MKFCGFLGFLDEKYSTFSNSPIHADYENDLNLIPQQFLGQDIQQTQRWSQKIIQPFYEGFRIW